MNNLPRKIHVIGICGVATSNIAIAFHNRGVEVTGSDKGFFPPVSTELTKHGIKYYAGWHPELMTENGMPELVIIGAASGTQNPETLFALDNKIPCYSFPEILAKYFIRPTSVVCAGTWGKTSSTALLSFILEYAKKDPTYMIGGISVSHEASAKLSDGQINVFEGDEYKSSPTDNRSKFEHYAPNHILLSAVEWDHADMYPTIESYFDAFRRLLNKVNQESGTIVANADNANINKLISEQKISQAKVITYGRNSNANYQYSDIKSSKSGLDFNIKNNGAVYNIHSPMLGTFQAENITGCFAMAHTLGVEIPIIIEAISKFEGIKRRLEKRLSGDIDVYDDIAHSADKANSVLKTLREVYSGKIIAIFEPNSGGRALETIHKYDNAFKFADLVLIPRLTKLKVSDDEKNRPIEGNELAECISKTHANCIFIDNDDELVGKILSTAKKGDVVIFMGSHGFRGMIDDCVIKLKN